MTIAVSLIVLFCVLFIIIACFTAYIYVKYRETKIILEEYENITKGYQELQQGIGKYRETSAPPHYFVGAVGSRNAANTYRK